MVEPVELRHDYVVAFHVFECVREGKKQNKEQDFRMCLESPQRLPMSGYNLSAKEGL